MKARLKFARRVARMSSKEVREEMGMSMDGVVIAVPPADPVDRLNFCRQGETHMWRTPAEYADPDLAGADSYVAQVPMARVVAMWGGISEGGCSEIICHKPQKFNSEECLGAFMSGKINAALRSVKPIGKRLWKALRDKEKFLHSKACQKALAAREIDLWFLPPRSPDLKPMERFRSWPRKELRRRDPKHLHAKKPVPVLGRMAFRKRVGGIMMYDISDPTVLTLLGSTTISNIHSIALAGRYVVASCFEDQALRIVDAGDPSAPFITHTEYLSHGPTRVERVGVHLYVSGFDGMHCYDLSDPANPALVQENGDVAYGFAVAGDFAFVAGGSKLTARNVWQNDYDTSKNIGQSLVFSDQSGIAQVKLAADVTGSDGVARTSVTLEAARPATRRRSGTSRPAPSPPSKRAPRSPGTAA